ncbi:ribonuclease H-like domain-containing protein [Halegenticoccus soli]|uniref:ribonuclease H-like domain-containing protein n=1 Tax=Halegenticoccus soli TaxID=1985678 RepID=UPI000C6D1159|nr:ribonuclease H-like domain-containing protein [Halegenticoccus soli]
MRIENSFIPVRGVGEATERKLWEHGVTHWDEFDGSVVGETTAGRIEEFIGVATERLDAGDSRFFRDAFPSGERWRLYENFRDDACFFDIETTGLSHRRDEVTTVSYRRGGETTTLVRGDDLTAETVREAFADAPLVVSFNGKRFDAPFLEESLGVEIDAPHVDLVYPCKRLGLTGGLKRVERDVGIERDRPDLSGRDAVRLWREYERGDEGALDTLISYNRDDADNLETLMDRVAASLHEETFGVVESA